MAVLRHVSGRKPLNDWLAAHANVVTSQCGEDGILEKVFEVLPEGSRWCVEIGAWDGQHLSNTWNLIVNHGWSAVLIEGDERKFGDLSERYRNRPDVHTLNTFVEFEGRSTLDGVLETTPIPTDFDLLCIDVDGVDYHIWASLKRYRPTVVVIEFNPTMPNDTYFVQDRDMEVHHGNSLRALVQLGRAKGYELISTTRFNAIFVQREHYPRFEIEDNDLDVMHSSAGYAASLVQLYDGTLLVSGRSTLVWRRGVRILPADIQVLPTSLREYGRGLRRGSRQAPDLPDLEAVPVDARGVDIAPRGRATQSSLSQWSAGSDEAQRAVGRAPTGGFAFHTAVEAEPWWKLDLGGDARFDEILVFNRLDGSAPRSVPLLVEVAGDHSRWRTVHRETSVFGGIDGWPLRVTIPDTKARWVRLRVDRRSALHLDAVSVYSWDVTST